MSPGKGSFRNFCEHSEIHIKLNVRANEIDTLPFVNVLIVVYSTFQSTLQNNIAAQGVLTKYNYRKYSMS